MSHGMSVISSEVISKEMLDNFVLQSGGYGADRYGVHLARGVAHIAIRIDNSILSATLLGDAPEQYEHVTQTLGAKPQTSIVVEIGGREARANYRLAFEFAQQCMEQWHCIVYSVDENNYYLTKDQLIQMNKEGRTFRDMDIEELGGASTMSE